MREKSRVRNFFFHSKSERRERSLPKLKSSRAKPGGPKRRNVKKRDVGRGRKHAMILGKTNLVKLWQDYEEAG